MSILCWNVRGLGDTRAFNRLRKAIRKYSPILVFLSETKVKSSSISKIKNSLGFTNHVVVDSIGSRGGLALFWNSEWDVVLKSYGPGHIDTIITDDLANVWRFTCFYGNSIRSNRNNSWELLKRLHSMYTFPWIIGGDFNEIVHLSEKIGRAACEYLSMNLFAEVIDQCRLMDLGYEGPQFTWTNKQHPPNTNQERLDRFFVNLEWKALFNNAQVTNQDFYGSDHRIIKLELHPVQQEKYQVENKRQSFKFEPFWRSHNNFKQIMLENWNSIFPDSVITPEGLMQKLSNFGQQLKTTAEEMGQ